MRRLKIVVSDFHLGEGQLTADGTINDLEDFVSDYAFIELVEHYSRGDYRDAEIEFVFNGDTFECLATVEPSDSEPDLITSRKSVKKIEKILSGHVALFDAIRRFAGQDNHHITFLVGNHDQDLLWDQVVDLLRERIHPKVTLVKDYYFFDGVHIEHGHQHEKHNRFVRHRLFLTRGLSEPILNLPWGSDLFVNAVLRLKRTRPWLNRVRPPELAMRWTTFNDLGSMLRGLWYVFVALIQARFRRHRQRRITFLQTLRVFLSRPRYPNLEDAAIRLLRSRSIHTVVFGHTHIPTWRQLLPGKTYVNSGSWIPTTNLHVAGLGRSLMQTFVCIECETNKPPRARLKVWHGYHRVEEDIVI